PPLTASSSLLLSRTSSCCSTASATTEIYTLSLHDALPISGGSWTAGATAPTEIELPGLLTARIVPGAPAAQMQETLDVARAALADALQHAGVADVASARSQVERRRELSTARETFAATVVALTGEDTLERLRARLAELDAAASDATGDLGVDDAQAELTAAERAYQQAHTDCETHRKAAVLAAR